MCMLLRLRARECMFRLFPFEIFDAGGGGRSKRRRNSSRRYFLGSASLQGKQKKKGNGLKGTREKEKVGGRVKARRPPYPSSS